MFGLALSTMASLFLCIFVGFIAAKKGILGTDSIDKLNTFLLAVAFPFMMLSIFNIELTPEFINVGLFVFLYGIGYLLLLTIVGFLVLKGLKVTGNTFKIMLFSFVFTNTGFVGLPLISAVMESNGLLYATILNIPFNILCFSLGVYILQPVGQNHINLKKILASPMMIAIWIGLVLLLSQLVLPGTFEYGDDLVRLPRFMTKTIDMIGGIASPLAMIIVGASLEQTKFTKVFKDYRLHIFSLFRLLIGPVITYVVFSNIIGDPTILAIVTIFAGLPTATMVTSLAEQFELDYVYSSEIVFMTTLYSLITVPIIFLLAL